MQKALLWKLGTVFGLTVLATIPLAMVKGLINERHGLKEGVVRSIEAETVGNQAIEGPVLVVPFEKVTLEVEQEVRGKQVVEVKKKVKANGNLFFLPETLEIEGAAGVEERRRGIYKAQAFSGAWKLRGRFDLPADFGVDRSKAEYTFGKPQLAFGIGDPRGLAPEAQLTWDGRAQPVEAGHDAPGLGRGIHADLESVRVAATHSQSAEFELSIALTGLSRMHFMPMGRVSTVKLDSTWPHPSFFGPLLGQHEIDDNGFRVAWRTSFLASGLNGRYADCFEGRGCDDLDRTAFGVNLVEPVNVYVLLERTAKYGLLFVGLTFAAFFLFDVLRQCPIHPVQYGLVGGALVIFYLLVTSLSEHIAFAPAYLAAAVSCVALIGYYVSHVLRSWRRGALVAGMIATLYAALFVILRSEDNALLMGSLLLFGLMAAIMVGTRKVDWYQVGSMPALGGRAAGG